MAPRLDDPAIERIEQARARHRAERRELATESAVAALVLVLAAVMALGTDVPWGLTAWLCGLLAAMALIRFEVGEGNTRPVHLAITPLLILLPPGLVPAAVIVAYLPAPFS